MSGGGGRELLLHRQLIPVVPASDDLAVLDLRNRDSRDLHSFIRRRKSQLVARVRHFGGPTHYDFVVSSNAVFDRHGDIWKRATNPLIECLEFPRPANHYSGLVLTHSDRVLPEQIIDRSHAPFIPNLFEPTPHQHNILFDRHHPPSFEQTKNSSNPCSHGIARSYVT